MRFKIAEFKGWTILGIPASLDDHRPGSKTVIFIEGKAVEGFKNFLKHDDATRIVEHIKSVLEASVDYYYPNHPEVEFEKDFR